jgi:SAM-dependent methyltransferase
VFDTDGSCTTDTTASASEPTCLICRGEAKVRYLLPNLWHQPVGSKPYEIRWCGPCDFGFLYPRPRLEEHAYLTRSAREAAREWPDLIPSQSSFLEKVSVHLAWRATVGKYRQMTASYIHGLAGDRPLNACIVGCSDVALMSELSQLGHGVVGLDDDELTRSVAHARGLEVYPGAPEALTSRFTAGTFDVVYFHESLPCCQDPLGAVEAATLLLKAGGHILADFPNQGSRSARRLGPAWFFFNAGYCINFFTTRSLAKMLEQIGWAPSDRLYHNYTVQFRRPRRLIEQTIWDRLYGQADRSTRGRPTRNSLWSQWTGLLGSMFCEPDEMFEAVAISGEKSPS